MTTANLILFSALLLLSLANVFLFGYLVGRNRSADANKKPVPEKVPLDPKQQQAKERLLKDLAAINTYNGNAQGNNNPLK